MSLPNIKLTILSILPRINFIYKSAETFLRFTFITRFKAFEPFLPSYNPVLAAVFFLFSKYALLVWIYGNILVIALCKALIEALKIFHLYVQHALQDNWDISTNMDQAKVKGESNDDELRKRFVEMWKLTENVGKFLSPLILSCYGMNVYFIITKVKNICSLICPS